MNELTYTSLIQAKKVMEILLRPEIKPKKIKPRKRKYYYKY